MEVFDNYDKYDSYESTAEGEYAGFTKEELMVLYLDEIAEYAHGTYTADVCDPYGDCYSDIEISMSFGSLDTVYTDYETITYAGYEGWEVLTLPMEAYEDAFEEWWWSNSYRFEY